MKDEQSMILSISILCCDVIVHYNYILICDEKIDKRFQYEICCMESFVITNVC